MELGAIHKKNLESFYFFKAIAVILCTSGGGGGGGRVNDASIAAKEECLHLKISKDESETVFTEVRIPPCRRLWPACTGLSQVRTIDDLHLSQSLIVPIKVPTEVRRPLKNITTTVGMINRALLVSVWMII